MMAGCWVYGVHINNLTCLHYVTSLEVNDGQSLNAYGAIVNTNLGVWVQQHTIVALRCKSSHHRDDQLQDHNGSISVVRSQNERTGQEDNALEIKVLIDGNATQGRVKDLKQLSGEHSSCITSLWSYYPQLSKPGQT